MQQDSYDNGMHKGAPVSSFQKALSLRKNMTRAEEILWARLRNKQCKNVKFRRQHPIHLFIVDFYCHSLGLIIEIDGEYHNDERQKLKDIERSKLLIDQDLHLIRFSNEEVYNNIDEVIRKIEERIDELK